MGGQRIFALCLFVATVAAAAPAVAQESPAVAVIDQREDVDQPPWRSFTANIGSCDYGVWQLSEQVGVGNRLGALQEDLASRVDPAAGVSSVIITRYDVFLNRAVDQRGFASSVAASAHGGVSTDGGPQRPSCERERMTVGWFDPAEATTPHSPLIIEIEATANGRGYVVRSTYSPDVELPSQCALFCRGGGRPRLQQPEQLAAFRAAMTKAHETLASEINAASSAAQ